jgi:hypothetical protein
VLPERIELCLRDLKLLIMLRDFRSLQVGVEELSQIDRQIHDGAVAEGAADDDELAQRGPRGSAGELCPG